MSLIKLRTKMTVPGEARWSQRDEDEIVETMSIRRLSKSNSQALNDILAKRTHMRRGSSLKGLETTSQLSGDSAPRMAP